MISNLYNLISKRTDFGYDTDGKSEYKSSCQKFFKDVDREIKRNFKIEDSSYSFNPGGIAVNGDPSYKVMFKDKIGVYVTLSLGSESPVMMRTITGLKDYTGGQNQWFGVSRLKEAKNCVDLIASLAKLAYD